MFFLNNMVLWKYNVYMDWVIFCVSQSFDFLLIQYNPPTPALVYSVFLSNPAKNSGPNNFPIYLNIKNISVIRIL